MRVLVSFPFFLLSFTEHPQPRRVLPASASHSAPLYCRLCQPFSFVRSFFRRAASHLSLALLCAVFRQQFAAANLAQLFLFLGKAAAAAATAASATTNSAQPWPELPRPLDEIGMENAAGTNWPH